MGARTSKFPWSAVDMVVSLFDQICFFPLKTALDFVELCHTNYFKSAGCRFLRSFSNAVFRARKSKQDHNSLFENEHTILG